MDALNRPFPYDSPVDLIPACVLIIEKHPLMREALCAAISDEPDLRVEMKALNGREALEMLGVILPDIILFAMGNPGSEKEELETLKRIRETVPQTPILALTSSEVPEQEQSAWSTGAYTVLTKAVTRAELISKLREIINDSGIYLLNEKNEKHPHSYIFPHRTTGKRVY
jgi:DNA-binding NarL/FixJ family response regulator